MSVCRLCKGAVTVPTAERARQASFSGRLPGDVQTSESPVVRRWSTDNPAARDETDPVSQERHPCTLAALPLLISPPRSRVYETAPCGLGGVVE